jgi:hypothetical protein
VQQETEKVKFFCMLDNISYASPFFEKEDRKIKLFWVNGLTTCITKTSQT